MDSGGSAVIEGQRMLPDTKGADYRMLVAGTEGYVDLSMADNRLTVTNPSGAEAAVESLPEPQSVVADWLDGGDLVGQRASLRANYLSVHATRSAEERVRIEVS